jgi:hypothetical protein
MVPYVAGTDRVDIEGPSGLLTSVTAGSSAPNVQWLSPTAGSTLPDGNTTLRWSASDAEGDPLTFVVQCSADDGATWRVVAQNVVGDSVVVDRRDLASSSVARLRLIASDGIHAKVAEIGGLNIGNRAPSIEILEPAPNNTIVAAQGVSLRALAYDTDDGLLDRLGHVRNVVKLAEGHGHDDPFYVARTGATFWSLDGAKHPALARDRTLVSPINQLARGIGAEPVGGWFDPHASQVQAIRVPAGEQRRVTRR